MERSFGQTALRALAGWSNPDIVMKKDISARVREEKERKLSALGELTPLIQSGRINTPEGQAALAAYSPELAIKLDTQTIKGADGYQYYLDTGERALPDVKKAGAFEGTGIEAQMLNIADSYLAKQRNNTPTTPQEDALFSFAKQRLERLQTNISPEGIITETPGYNLAALGGLQNTEPSGEPQQNTPMQLTPAKRLEKTDELTQLRQSLEASKRIRKSIEDDRTKGGAVGTARRGLETGIGVTRDIGSVVPIPGLESLLSGVESAAELGDKGTVTKLDPDVSSLVYGVARMRHGSGKLPVDAVNNARNDINPRGFKSAKQAIEKLITNEEALARTIAQYEADLGISAKTSKKATKRWNPETGKIEDIQ
jgi:hypothetical protein